MSSIESWVKPTVEFVGPFEDHKVVVGGWTVPFLVASPQNGGMIHLTLDDRIGLDLSVADAEGVMPFIADCIAVAAGYTCHPGTADDPGFEPLQRHPMHRMYSVGPALP